MNPDQRVIQLSLVSHTNVGKTTLARTLLGRDIGEVLDQAHVTVLAESHPLIELPDGGALLLWDTPGFGDSPRLAGRLRQRGNPIGWFLGEVLDRWLNRPLWASQQVIKNVREESDVVLYLVNATENPADAAYVDAEMEILSWIGKPVIVLLNQTGEPRPAALETAEKAKWQGHLARFEFVSQVLPMDAFARCWVQELTLLEAIAEVLPAAQQATFRALQAAWQARRLASFRQSAQAIARYLHALARDRQAIEETTGLLSKIKQTVGLSSESVQAARRKAMAALADRAAQALRELTNQLIELHGLKGRASQEVLQRWVEELKLDQAASPKGAAVVGGVVGGALSGLTADLMAGGLTLGVGTLAGALMGALGGAGIAQAYNIVGGKAGASARWSHEALHRIFGESLLLYLAVAHFGRGRGEWSRAEHPAHWRTEVAEQVAGKSAVLDEIWPLCDNGGDDGGAGGGDDVDASAGLNRLTEATEQSLNALLSRLYPASRAIPELTEVVVADGVDGAAPVER